MSFLTFANEEAKLSSGRYAGELLEDVVDEDPTHLRHALENRDLTSREREAIEEALGDEA